MFKTIDRSPCSAALPGEPDPLFAAFRARLQQLADGPASGSAGPAQQAELRACLGELDRIHAGFGREVGRRRRLELEAFDARVSRLRAAQHSGSARREGCAATV